MATHTIPTKFYVDTQDSTHVTNDDHTQYHNDTRGDARYYTKAETYTKAEVDAIPTGGTKTFIASGTIPTGEVVVLNGDGTVSIVNATNAGSPVTSNALYDNEGYCYSIVIDTNKILVSYASTSRVGMAIVGTISGTSITFGTAVSSGINNSYGKVIKLDTNKVVIVNYDHTNTNTLKAIVATISGTVITFGTAVTVTATAGSYAAGLEAIDTSRFIISYSGSGTKAVVGTVTGTTIVLGTAVTLNAYTYHVGNIVKINTDKMFISYSSSSTIVQAVIATISGNVITLGTPVNFPSTSNGRSSVKLLNTDRVIVAYYDITSGMGMAVIVTISGTTITFANHVSFASIDPSYSPSIELDLSTNTCIISYVRDASNGGYIVGDITENTVVFLAPVVFTSDIIMFPTTTCIDSSKVCVVYQQSTTTDVLKATILPIYNIIKYIGISETAAIDSASVDVSVISGINTIQTGLITGSKYYLSATGELTTTQGSYEIGRALSPTEILITKGGA